MFNDLLAVVKPPDDFILAGINPKRLKFGTQVRNLQSDHYELTTWAFESEGSSQSL